MPKNLPTAEKADKKDKAIKASSKPDIKSEKKGLKKDGEKALQKAFAKAEKQAKRNAKLDALIPAGQFIKTRKSGVHGKGMFAVAPIAEGQHLIEYPKQPNHTFYFSLEDGRCIDAKVGGNDSRWINHSCKPNCEADETHGRVFIKALRNIEKGEELFYNYGLVIDEKYTKKLKAEYACWCGAPKCRGTMLAPKKKD
jgi:uncharacterized protein